MAEILKGRNKDKLDIHTMIEGLDGSLRFGKWWQTVEDSRPEAGAGG